CELRSSACGLHGEAQTDNAAKRTEPKKRQGAGGAAIGGNAAGFTRHSHTCRPIDVRLMLREFGEQRPIGKDEGKRSRVHLRAIYRGPDGCDHVPFAVDNIEAERGISDDALNLTEEVAEVVSSHPWQAHGVSHD